MYNVETFVKIDDSSMNELLVIISNDNMGTPY